MSRVVIDLGTLDRSVLSGRAEGAGLRERFALDRLDEIGQAEIRIPESVYTVTSSFFLGMFAPSVVKAGCKESFYAKYHFAAPDRLCADLDGYVARVLHATGDR